MQIQDIHFLQNCWTVLEAFNRAVLIENQVKGAQSIPFSSKINAWSGDATSNFTKKVENGWNVAKSSKASKVPAKNQPVLSNGETLVVEEIEDQDFLVKELEDQDIGHLVSNSYIEEQVGEGGQELTECIISMVESVCGQYVEWANAVVKEANDCLLTTRVMQVLKQEVEDDRQHKGYVLCEEVAMNGFHLLHRCEK